MLIMTLRVRDEEDILEANLKYHLESGVDHIIVTDNRSVDGTPDIISRYVQLGCVTSLYDEGDDHDQSGWVTHMARLAFTDFRAKWVINNDADEFWMPRNAPDLKRQFFRYPSRNVVIAQRSDFVCLDDETGPFWERMIYRKTLSTNALGKKLPPKSAHRAHPGITVSPGNHRVSGFRWQRTARSGVEILHFPMRSRSQYTQKIITGGQAYLNKKDGSPKQGATWRAQYQEWKDTGRIAFLEENVLSPSDVKRQLEDGKLVIDTRLKNFFSLRK